MLSLKYFIIIKEGGKDKGKGRKKRGERKKERKDYFIFLPNVSKLTLAPSVPIHTSWRNLVKCPPCSHSPAWLAVLPSVFHLPF